MKKVALLLILACVSVISAFATVLPSPMSDGDVLYSAQVNQMVNEREGHLLPISPSTDNYIDATQNIGSAAYRWNKAYINNVLGSRVGARIIDVGDGSEGAFTTTTSSTLDGEHFYSDFEVAANTTLNIGAANWLIIRVSGTFTWNGVINGKGKGGAKGCNGGVGTAGGWTGGFGGQANTTLGGDPKAYNQTMWPYVVAGGVYDITGNMKFAYTHEWPSYGAGGGGSTSAGGTCGGNGGGGMMIIAKNVILTGTPTADMRGNDADNTTFSGGGGGGVFAVKWVTWSGTTSPVVYTVGGNGWAGTGGIQGWQKID